MLAVIKSRNAGLYGKIKTFHIFDILCWFSIMFSCCIWCILEQCLNSNINNSIKFTFFHLKCPIFIICDVAWGMTPCVTCLRVRDDGCTRWGYLWEYRLNIRYFHHRTQCQKRCFWSRNTISIVMDVVYMNKETLIVINKC